MKRIDFGPWRLFPPAATLVSLTGAKERFLMAVVYEYEGGYSMLAGIGTGAIVP